MNISVERYHDRWRAVYEEYGGYGDTKEDAVENLMEHLHKSKIYQGESMNINQLRDAVKSQIARYEAVLRLTELATPPAALHTLIEDCCERGLELTIDFCGVDNEYDYDKLPDFGEGDITLSESSSKS